MLTTASWWRLIAATVVSASVARSTSDTSTTTAPPPAAAYTDQPRAETYPTPYYSSASVHSFDSPKPMLSVPGDSFTIRRPDIIFFPPLAPALGDPLPQATPLLRHQPIPPPELSFYLHEIFMPQLGTLLYHNDLPRKWRVQVGAYRVRRDAAQEALREQLAAARLLARDARTAALAEFARVQQPVLEALEREAERIRELMTNGSIFREGSNWNDSRRWRLGDDTQWESNLDEFRVLRAAAFYERGLSPEQRDLLREMTADLVTLLEDPFGEINLGGPGPALAFSPSPARLRLPGEVPPALAAALTRYREEKAALKRELRDQIYVQDRAWFASRRTQALRALAESQAPRFEALDGQAEALRRELDELPGLIPDLVTAGLPPALLDRITRYLTDKTHLQETMNRKLQELRAELPFDRIEYSRIGAGYGIVHLPSRRTRRTDRPAALDAELRVFNAEQVARFEELTRERTAIQSEVTRMGDTLLAGTSARSIDSLLRQFDERVQLQQRWLRYQDYHDATLLAGLSPAQRRLLFAAGMTQLAPPITYSPL
jgi:hypothetical protein